MLATVIYTCVTITAVTAPPPTRAGFLHVIPLASQKPANSDRYFSCDEHSLLLDVALCTAQRVKHDISRVYLPSYLSSCGGRVAVIVSYSRFGYSNTAGALGQKCSYGVAGSRHCHFEHWVFMFCKATLTMGSIYVLSQLPNHFISKEEHRVVAT
jgi:hypothetical protein